MYGLITEQWITGHPLRDFTAKAQLVDSLKISKTQTMILTFYTNSQKKIICFFCFFLEQMMSVCVVMQVGKSTCWSKQFWVVYFQGNSYHVFHINSLHSEEWRGQAMEIIILVYTFIFKSPWYVIMLPIFLNLCCEAVKNLNCSFIKLFW